MRSGKDKRRFAVQELEPLETLQLGARVYQALLNSIVSGQIGPGAPLRPEVIARQLEVSTTPVREAMHRIEGDGLAIKLPYQGWLVGSSRSSRSASCTRFGRRWSVSAFDWHVNASQPGR